MIPPERVGINGEYDHSGLVKRIKLAYCKQFEAKELSRLHIAQRGRVVVLMGSVSSQQILTQLVNIAFAAHGTAAVEKQGVRVDRSGIWSLTNQTISNARS